MNARCSGTQSAKHFQVDLILELKNCLHTLLSKLVWKRQFSSAYAATRAD